MQENRAFDHYYGSLRGVRGFNDRAATPTRFGHDTFMQPLWPHNGTSYMLPFHVQAMTTAAMCMDAPLMEYFTNMGIVDGGRYDYWNVVREAGMGMSFFNRSDLPYYYALCDGFVVGDHYFQSSFTETNPNRMHLFTGSNGLSVGGLPVLYNIEPNPGYEWETMAETLQAANVSWRVYQQHDNFDDNAFAWFRTFQEAQPGSVWFDKGMYRAHDVVAEFTADLAAGTLPQVSWIVGPTNLSEHASYHPAAGEDFSARILRAVQAHPDMYRKMVFILNYDEGGQFYDHLWSPVPPLDQPADGVSTATTKGEVFPFFNASLPIGLGYRVPLIIVSPWTRGNIVYSDVLDHTSVIQLLEQRFNVTCPNISPWRRATAGDMLDAFDWDHPDYSWPELPNTSTYAAEAQYECEHNPAPAVPAEQAFPQQEPGVRIARALRHYFAVSFSISTDGGPALAVRISPSPVSRSGSFIWYDVRRIDTVDPQRFLVEPGKAATAAFPVNPSNYSFALHGVNGFVRTHRGEALPPVMATLLENPSSEAVELRFVRTAAANSGLELALVVTDNAYNTPGSPWAVVLPAGVQETSLTLNISASGFWYDLTAAPGPGGQAAWEQRFMGHMEVGRDTVSDPAMGAGLPGSLYGDRPASPAPLPDSVRYFKRRAGSHKDAKYYKRDEL
jgi:phospholipase C